MTGNLTTWTAVALVVALAASVGAMSGNARPMHLSRAQFHDNCAAADGQFAVLGSQVICSLAADRQIVCQFGTSLGNCLWTGRVEAATLARVFASPGA